MFARVLLAVPLLLGMSVSPAFGAEPPSQPYAALTLGTVSDVGPFTEDGAFYFVGAGDCVHLVRSNTNEVVRSVSTGRNQFRPLPKFYYDDAEDAPVIFTQTGAFIWHWDTNTFTQIAPGLEYRHAPEAVFTNGAWLYGVNPSELEIVSSETGQVIRRPQFIDGVRPVAFNPQGTRTIVVEEGNERLPLRVYSLVNDTFIATLDPGAQLDLTGVAFSPDGARAATSYAVQVSGLDTRLVSIWDVESGDELQRKFIPGRSANIQTWNALGIVTSGPGYIEAYSPISLDMTIVTPLPPNTLPISFDDVRGKAFLITSLNPEEVSTLDVPHQSSIVDLETGQISNPLNAHYGIFDFHVRPSGAEFHLVDTALAREIWIFGRQRLLHSLSPVAVEDPGLRFNARVALNADASLAAVFPPRFGNSFHLWNLENNGSSFRSGGNNTVELGSATFSPDNQNIAFNSPLHSQRAIVWDLASNERTTVLSTSIAFTGRAMKEVIAYLYGNQISIGPVEGPPARVIDVPLPEGVDEETERTVRGINLTTDGDFFSLAVHYPEPEVTQIVNGATETGELRTFDIPYFADAVTSIPSPDGLFACVFTGETIAVHHAPTGVLLKTINNRQSARSATFSSDGKWLFTGTEEILQWPISAAAAEETCPGQTADADGDGLSDCFENAFGTEAANSDSDGDRVPDGLDLEIGLDPRIPDLGPDTDADGLSDSVEALLGTSPDSADTDGDGATDADELAAGTDPLVDETEGEGAVEGEGEGSSEGSVEGSAEGDAEGEGGAEGATEGQAEGNAEGSPEGDGEGGTEGQQEGSAEGDGEGAAEGEPEGGTEGEVPDLPALAQDILDALDTIDLDNDGLLTALELDAAGLSVSQATFALIDSNNDGFITQAELIAAGAEAEQPGCGCDPASMQKGIRYFWGDFFTFALAALVLAVMSLGVRQRL